MASSGIFLVRRHRVFAPPADTAVGAEEREAICPLGPNSQTRGSRPGILLFRSARGERHMPIRRRA